MAHAQIADRLSIPKKYYDRMREENPALLDANVNAWLKTQADAMAIADKKNLILLPKAA